MAMILVLGIATEYPHHDDDGKECHSALGDEQGNHVHFQVNGVTPFAIDIEPVQPVDQAIHTYSYTTPLTPFFQIDRPPKSDPVTV